MQVVSGVSVFTAAMFIVASLGVIAGFFFIATRGALLMRSVFGMRERSADHVYPIYSQWWLMKLVDHQPIISAILLFQYSKLVDRIVLEISRTALLGKRVLITSCAFGNVIPRLADASSDQDAERIVITDIIKNELLHVKGKLAGIKTPIDYVLGDALNMKQEDGVMEMNVLFFLLHELPNTLKEVALAEAGRVIAPGGKLVLAEFHRPDSYFLRLLSRMYFYVFEPYGLSLWDTHDPFRYLDESGKWECTRETYFLSNFQVIVAIKK